MGGELNAGNPNKYISYGAGVQIAILYNITTKHLTHQNRCYFYRCSLELVHRKRFPTACCHLRSVMNGYYFKLRYKRTKKRDYGSKFGGFKINFVAEEVLFLSRDVIEEGMWPAKTHQARKRVRKAAHMKQSGLQPSPSPPLPLNCTHTTAKCYDVYAHNRSLFFASLSFRLNCISTPPSLFLPRESASSRSFLSLSHLV